MFLLFPPQLDAWAAVLNTPDLAGATVCATVIDDAGNVVFDRNGSIRAIPASNHKLLSAAFALYELGPDYRPVTNVWKLSDRVIVESPGDPTMTRKNLADVAHRLGLDGKLPVFVKQAYDPEFHDEWEIGDLPNRYAAPVAAFSVDQSGFELWNRNETPDLEPAAYGTLIRHRPTKSKKPTFAYDPIKRLVTVSGIFPKKTERLDTLAVPAATEAAASVFGCSASPIETIPTDLPTASVVGKPLSEILTNCLRPSDNNIAENLLLMGASHEGPLDVANPYPEARDRMREFMERVVGIERGDSDPHDGSGLSRFNMVTTRSIVRLLQWAQSQPTVAVWKNAMASPGVGTLKRRLAGLRFKGKTGSLTHVTALSGYLVTGESKNLTISVIVNNFSCSEEKAREAIDKFIKLISEKGP